MKNINRIFLLGDSWIEGQGTYETIEGKNAIEPNLPFGEGKGSIREWRRNNSWNKFFEEKYGIKVINLGVQGGTNSHMYSHLNHILLDYKPTDLILLDSHQNIEVRLLILVIMNHHLNGKFSTSV